MKHKDFVAFILTHGRPDKVHTYRSLKREGYTGPIVVLIDNEDKTAEEYKKKFGKEVYVFDKAKVAETFDEADNFGDRRTIVYARNACFEVARELGYKYFIELDDDYTDFRYKADDELQYVDKTNITRLDYLFDALLDYYISIPAKSIAIAQGGDFIGGKNSDKAKRLRLIRKCMNTFICSVDRPFKFVGRINEDVNTYVCAGGRGDLFLTITNLAINQVQTQSNSGGMTDIYLDSGTYIKSFYTVLFSPSCTKIRLMGAVSQRLHHSIRWKNAVPVILEEIYRK